MPKKIKVPRGCVLMRHDDASASCTVDGVGYQAVDGLVVVPAEAVETLRSHGFTPDGENAEQDPAPEPEPAGEPVVEPVVEAEPAAETEA